MAIGMVVTGLATWPVAAEFGFAGMIMGLMLAGAMSGPVEVATVSLRQRRTKPRQLSRAMSVSISLNIAGFPLGAAIAGVVITQLLSAIFVLAGIASVTAAIATLSIPPDSVTVG